MVLCAFCVITAEAQKPVTVKSFTQTTDHISSKDRRSDFNGSPCALVKVQVVDDIERIEGNKIGDIVNRGVEKWVYMCKGSRNMRIHLKKHLPIKIMFQDYHINGLEGNRVYELVLDIPDAPQTATVQDMKYGTFKMNVSPQTAMVTIWGDNMQKKVYRPQDDGTLTVELPYGRYNYSVQAEGYRDFESNFFVIDNNLLENVNLSPIEGSLYIKCSTAHVDFSIDGRMVNKKKSETVWMGQVPPGQYDVTVSRKGYVTEVKTINVLANQTTRVSFDRLKTEKEQAAAERKAEKVKKQKTMQLKTEAEQATVKRKAEKVKKEATNKSQKSQRKDDDDRTVVFGCRAGVNIASLGVADGKCSMKTGVHVGPSADIRLSNSLYLNTSILFSQKGYKYNGKIRIHYERLYDYYDILEKATAQFVMLPIQLSYRIGMFQISAGPYLDYGIGGTIEIEDLESLDTFDYYKTLNFGVTTGLGVTIARHFYISANYEFGLSDYANRNIAISLGYKF